MQRHQWLALTLLVTMVVILLLDTTRAVSELLPSPLPVQELKLEHQDAPQPASDPDRLDDRRLALASQA